MKIALRIAAFAAALAGGVCMAQTPEPVNATLIYKEGSVLVNQGERFEPKPVGTRLKQDDRVMAMEKAKARIYFFEDCEVEVDEDTTVTVPDQLPCECLDFEDEKGPVARVDQLEGLLSVKRGDFFSPIPLNTELVIGDIIRVAEDSKTTIRFRDGCRQEVEENEDYEIPDSSPCACALLLVDKANPVGLTRGTIARILIPPLILIGISLPDNDGPISP